MISGEQALFFQHRPEAGRNLSGHGRDVCRHALGPARAEREGDDARMRFAELNADLSWDLSVLLAEREELLAPGEFLSLVRICPIELDIVKELAAG